MKIKNQKFMATERRLSEDRRVTHSEEYYIGQERRTGFDARGGEKLGGASANINDKKESNDFDWLFGQGIHSIIQGRL